LLVKQLTQVRTNLSITPSYLIGNHCVTLNQSEDHHNICNGLTLWVGILLDINTLLMDLRPEEANGRDGRIMKMQFLCGSDSVNLTSLLTFLDDIDNWLLNQLSTSSRFKGDLPKGILVPNDLGCVMSLVRSICYGVRNGEVGDVEAVKWIHQICSFLSKIELDRPDLVETANADFISFEHDLSIASPLRDNHEVASILNEMNSLARKTLHDWKLGSFLPQHGPGAVADPKVKCWYEKYLHTRSDRRIAYLLDHSCLGTEKDYCPWLMSEKSTRTSRFISVPKTWKKLRGISAEPVELQFYQQGVRRSIDSMFSESQFWKHRVNLHDQSISGQLALFGSITGSYATIDLSAASDSVTLELVKEVFKGTPLLYWLLGTRSTSTECDKQTVRIKKFAPMGSATCFPVECIIFTLAAQVASDRVRIPALHNSETIRVFGDDIIIDYFAADELIGILKLLGFRVNTRKTFTTGCFREACGIEAYRGVEVQPLRFKRLSSNLNTWNPPVSEISVATSYSNSLFERGFRSTRAYLVHALLKSRVTVGGQTMLIEPYLTATFSGERGSLVSPNPTNFQKLRKFSMEPPQDKKVPWYQVVLVKSMGLRLRIPSWRNGSEISELFSWFKYHEWQMRHQPNLVDYEKMWEKGWIDLGAKSDYDQRVPLGSVIVPTVKWVPWTYENSLS